MSTGFFGKIPATGDFVSRRLPADFVRAWDRWVARYLAPLQASDIWADHVGLRFLTGPMMSWPIAGIVLPSADRVGRRFPLTVAAPISLAAIGFAQSASHWFAEIERVARVAQCGEIIADELEAELAKLPFPTVEAVGEIVQGMVFWTDRSDIFDVEPDDPRTALEQLLAPSWETN